MAVQGSKIQSIQFLRFVAATLVVLFHAHLAISTSLSPESAIDADLYLFGFGAVGVHIFFVISGYIMVLTNSRPDRPFSARQFYKKRLIRIYPIYWLIAALYLVINTVMGSPYEFTAYELLSSLLLLPDNAPLIIGPAWTLAYEMYFYLIFGIAMIFGLLRGLILLSLFFTISMALGLFVRPENAFTGLMTNSLLAEFLIGAWIAWVTLRVKFPGWLGYLSVAGSVILYAGGIVIGYESLPSALIWGVPSAMLVFGAVVLERHVQPAFVTQLSPLGDSSYTLYLAHILLITILIALAQVVQLTMLPILLMTAVFTVICVLFSHWFHLQVEAPMTARLTTWSKRV
ncbi:Peptidoglycan/LPS O-acetylase OafA/YrhL, contains acyltransferase and SGNH-hydrolase domains [Parasphingorhabdus marina DSM 22363]|uniref:Peptidoglycan/LPS O-acetylase OafA/YrhL, contains acyltransferase and SGNH-hydrolase domains n=2 Tax=Parasphingorhabdus marina TaxID=394732 RepID=A0A1N6CP64_9SPHN|nr:Peptidoglycan/LPS O-acetylase OafA/YrhL, contains acyltransferase and SGNH-hydrolase domains [Parasphingorhabdus marina DSM 22363]